MKHATIEAERGGAFDDGPGEPVALRPPAPPPAVPEHSASHAGEAAVAAAAEAEHGLFFDCAAQAVRAVSDTVKRGGRDLSQCTRDDAESIWRITDILVDRQSVGP